MNSVARFTGMNGLARLPSTEVLGYFQSSAMRTKEAPPNTRTLSSFEGLREANTLHVGSSRCLLGGPRAQVFCQCFVSSLNVDDQPTAQSFNQPMLVRRRSRREITLQVLHLNQLAGTKTGRSCF